MAKQRGLTLLEMLVALSIMSAVMMLASSAYRYYVLGFNLQQKQLSVQMNQLKINTGWQQQLAATAQYYVRNLDVNLLLYVGKSHELTWVSHRSVQHADLPAIAWMGLEDGQWFYCEATIRQLLVTTAIPDSNQICSYYKQAIGPANQLNFSYFGWKSPAEKYAGISEGTQQVSPFKQEWYGEYFGESTQLLPTYTKLDVTHDGVTNSYWIQIVESDPDKTRIFMGGKDA
jgi:prepilin-type N-terminal cleavage/methylation domain-containing protein